MANPEAGIAQGRMRQLCGDRISGPYRMPYIGSCVFRREVLEVCGGFDETMTLGEDHDLIYRCWEKDIVKVHVDEVSLIYRRHAGNTSRGNNLRSHLMVLKRRVDRIRAGLVDPSQKRRFPFQEYMGDTEGASQWTHSGQRRNPGAQQPALHRPGARQHSRAEAPAPRNPGGR